MTTLFRSSPVAKEIAALRAAQEEMLVHNLFVGARLEVYQVALQRIAQLQTEEPRLDGMPIPHWISAQVVQLLRTYLLNIPDEQLAAKIQARIGQILKDAKERTSDE